LPRSNVVLLVEDEECESGGLDFGEGAVSSLQRSKMTLKVEKTMVSAVDKSIGGDVG